MTMVVVIVDYDDDYDDGSDGNYCWNVVVMTVASMTDGDDSDDYYDDD